MAGLVTLQRELERMFENPLGFDLGMSSRGVFPAVNIFRDKDGLVVRLEVPGVAPDQINIEFQGRTLTITGKREVTSPAGGSFHRRERGTGEFSRSLQLPSDVDVTRAEASCKHGVLTIRVPKREEAKPRQITVKAA
jgi:HSP20 family protein